MGSKTAAKVFRYIAVSLTGVVIAAGGWFLRETTKSIETLADDNAKNHGVIRAQLAKQDTVANQRFDTLEVAIMKMRWLDSTIDVARREHKLEVDEHLEGPCHDSM